MIAVILAGGKGTRLAPYNTVFPKPMVPLGDRPILDIVVRQLTRQGFDRIVLSVGHLAELIQAYFAGELDRFQDANVMFVREDKPLGTVGSLRLVPEITEPFLVMNGDILTTLDFKAFYQHHMDQGGDLTIATHQRKVHIDLGVMDVSADGVITGFSEKPTYEYAVSMGVYMYNPGTIEYITPGTYFDFPDLVLRLLEEGKRIVSYMTDAYWLDLGTHADYRQAQEDFDRLRPELLPEEAEDV